MLPCPKDVYKRQPYWLVRNLGSTSIIAVVSDVLASRHTHAEIDQMMEASGLELNPLPGGNRQVKTKAWFNHANKSFPDPLSVLGNEISISV